MRSEGFKGTWEASAVVSMVATRRLVMESTLERRAWGRTILLIICGNDIPRALAASICPTGMVLTPLIKYSEQNAAGIRVVAIRTQV